MIEVPLYIIFAPALAITLSFIFGFKNTNIMIGPSIVFFLLSFPAVILPAMNYNVGVGAIFGWAFTFAIITLLLTLVIKSSVKSRFKKKKD